MHFVLAQFPAAIEALKEKGEHSSWNYRNKILLLDALSNSATGNRESIKSTFRSAILAARSSKFVHEEGLSCEVSIALLLI